MALILHAPTANSRASKIVIAAQLTKIPLIQKNIDYKDLKTKQYLSKHPLGKVPLLETPEGYIFESFTILRYIARRANALYGANPFEQAQVESWLESTLTEFDPMVIKLSGSVCGWGPLTEFVHNNIYKELKEWFKNLDSHLKDKTYLVGNSITIADIAVATYVHYVYRLNFDEKARAAFPHVLRWFNQISSIPAFKNVMGPTWFCQQAFEQVLTQMEVQKKQITKQKEPRAKQQKKKEQTVAEKKPQTQNKNKKKKQQENEEEEEPTLIKKQANPLDLLPKSTFSLDDFKRQISNNPDKLSAAKGLWQKFDAEGWSLWRSIYEKYEGEGVVGYSTSNLMKGFLRNLETFRKYTFAMFGVYGVEGNYDIKGVWLWRGTEIPQEIRDHQSYEYHKFIKLDHNNEADRKIVETFWGSVNQGDLVEGQPLYDAKYFK